MSIINHLIEKAPAFRVTSGGRRRYSPVGTPDSFLSGFGIATGKLFDHLRLQSVTIFKDNI